NHPSNCRRMACDGGGAMRRRKLDGPTRRRGLRRNRAGGSQSRGAQPLGRSEILQEVEHLVSDLFAVLRCATIADPVEPVYDKACVQKVVVAYGQQYAFELVNVGKRAGTCS